MFYRVTARLNAETASDLYRKLGDGTIRDQRPDGEEIFGALNRAVVTDEDEVVFSIVCYCSTPLAHERATVFDKHFDDLKTEVIESHEKYEGRSLTEYLAQVARSSVGTSI